MTEKTDSWLAASPKRAVKLLRRTPLRTFVLYPLIILAWELMVSKGGLQLEPWFSPLMVWGYSQYRLCGLYRIKHGGGGPGLDSPPDRMVLSGPYAFTRNPMYLGHLIFLVGLALTLTSLLGALLALFTAVWFHFRVLGDEKRLAEQLGEPYAKYTASVKRWIPGLF